MFRYSVQAEPMTVSDIIETLGGRVAVARYTGWPYTTIDSWITANRIPDWRRPALLRMALEVGAELSTADFPDKLVA